MSRVIDLPDQFEDSSVLLMARLLAADDGAALQQADLSSIALSVYDECDPSTAIATATLTISAVVFNTLQTDARWTLDSTGYNFAYWTATTHMPHGNRTYRFEIKYTHAGGQVGHQVWRCKTIPLLRS